MMSFDSFIDNMSSHEQIEAADLRQAQRSPCQSSIDSVDLMDISTKDQQPGSQKKRKFSYFEPILNEFDYSWACKDDLSSLTDPFDALETPRHPAKKFCTQALLELCLLLTI